MTGIRGITSFRKYEQSKACGMGAFGPVVSLREFAYSDTAESYLKGSAPHFFSSKCDHETLFPKGPRSPEYTHFLE